METFDETEKDHEMAKARAHASLTLIRGLGASSSLPIVRTLAQEADEEIVSMIENGFLSNARLDALWGEGVEGVAAMIYRLSEDRITILHKPRFVGAAADEARREITLRDGGKAQAIDNAVRARVAASLVCHRAVSAIINGSRFIFIDENPEIPADASCVEDVIISRRDDHSGSITLARVAGRAKTAA